MEEYFWNKFTYFGLENTFSIYVVLTFLLPLGVYTEPKYIEFMFLNGNHMLLDLYLNFQEMKNFKHFYSLTLYNYSNAI